MSIPTPRTSLPPQPTLFIPHGGGPCFFMDWTMGPADTWEKMRLWLSQLPQQLPQPPRAIVIISGHWETREFAVTGNARPPLIYDYSGFPEHTYKLQYAAPGDPALADQIRALLGAAGFPTQIDTARGFDHGVFIPFKVIYPLAQIPIVQLSLLSSLDPARHIAAGRALSALRKDNVLIVGSGMSYHNLREFFRGQPNADSDRFDNWLTPAVTAPTAEERNRRLLAWADAPAARSAHPREEHLLPLMVAAGAAGEDIGRRIFTDRVMGATVSAYAFGA